VGNDYLEGNYAPVRRECTITGLVVTGTIPAHLDGRYLRNGPNPIAEVDPDTYHWFTGDGMVHGVRLRDGKAQWYRNRWIRTPAAARALGETVPRRAPIRAGLEFLGANTNVLSHAGHTLALIESGITICPSRRQQPRVDRCDSPSGARALRLPRQLAAQRAPPDDTLICAATVPTATSERDPEQPGEQQHFLFVLRQ
jgi:carotenoid cleavage dioxygenase